MASFIIGMIGTKQSGKDTAASRLVAEHGFTRVAFADPIREYLLALDPLIPFPLGGQPRRLKEVIGRHGWDQAKEVYPEVRRLGQAVGDEAGRQILGESIWLDLAMAKVDAVPGPVVITDVRYPNEYETVVGRSGTLVRIERPGTEAGDHPSEAMAVNPWAWPAHETIDNSGTVQDLHDMVDRIADARVWLR